MQDDADLVFRQMTRAEVDQLVEWAAQEGWNPGLNDADLFWNNDPDAFIAADQGGELIGGGAITAYGDRYGFMGFFIVQPQFRGRGLGNRLWHSRRDRLLARLAPGSTIGMDGVFDMQSYYAAGGFVFSHRNLRFQWEPAQTRVEQDDAIKPTANAPPAPRPLATGNESLVPLASLDLALIRQYDRQCFPADRPDFVRRWITQPGVVALGCVRRGQLAGYGVLRPCRSGSKIGPLFADDEQAADALFRGLVAAGPAGPVFLDAPENHPGAMSLVERHGMTEVFGCARMYLGPVPDIAHEKVFGVTTFELG